MSSSSFEFVTGCWIDRSDMVSLAVVPLIVTNKDKVPDPPCWNSQFNEWVRSPSMPARSRTALVNQRHMN